MKKLIAILLSLVLVLSFAACSKDDDGDSKSKKSDTKTTEAVVSDEDLIKETVSKLEKSFNDRNGNDFIACLDPDSQKTVQALMKEYGVSEDDFAEEVFGGFENGSTFEITVNSINIQGEKATVNATLKNSAEEDSEGSEDDFDMIKVDGKWYIDGKSLGLSGGDSSEDVSSEDSGSEDDSSEDDSSEDDGSIDSDYDDFGDDETDDEE